MRGIPAPSLGKNTQRRRATWFKYTNITEDNIQFFSASSHSEGLSPVYITEANISELPEPSADAERQARITLEQPGFVPSSATSGLFLHHSGSQFFPSGK